MDKTKKFSVSWKSSSKPRKQKNYRANAPLHIKRKLMSSHLSKELKGKYGKRSVGIRKGDKVKIAVGQFNGKTGKIDKVDIKRDRVFITGIDVIKKDGTKTNYPIHPSNLIVIELELDDKMRQKILRRK